MTQAPATPSFGDVVENGWASEENPTRKGYFVRAFKRIGRMNPGLTWEVTDRAGRFWEVQPRIIGDRLTVTPQAAALEAQQARIAELEVENERLRLTMLGGEDVAGFASSLPLAQVLDSFRTYETALRDSANSAQALADRYEKALRPFAAAFDAFSYDEPIIDLDQYRAMHESVCLNDFRQASLALSSPQGRHEGGEEPAGIYPRWKGVTQPCDVCGKPVAVNAVSPSECHCSEACGLIAYGLDKPSPDNTNPKAGAPEHG